ncbi:MAG: hypothetical protein M0C28_12875 [Candidatus Moduliflexus flocculans]|nr:hypothetical protein [Candidatus Moduliflexus flocculans]
MNRLTARSIASAACPVADHLCAAAGRRPAGRRRGRSRWTCSRASRPGPSAPTGPGRG